MSLSKYDGKKVHIVSTEDTIYEGIVGDYIYPDDNEPEGEEGIVLDNLVRGDGYRYDDPIQFNASEIKFIKIIQ